MHAMVAAYPLDPPTPLEIATRKIVDGVPLTREERLLIEARLDQLSLPAALAKLHACEELSDDERDLIDRHAPKLTAADLTTEIEIDPAAELAYLRGEGPDPWPGV